MARGANRTEPRVRVLKPDQDKRRQAIGLRQTQTASSVLSEHLEKFYCVASRSTNLSLFDPVGG